MSRYLGTYVVRGNDLYKTHGVRLRGKVPTLEHGKAIHLAEWADETVTTWGSLKPACGLTVRQDEKWETRARHVDDINCDACIAALIVKTEQP